MQSVADSSDGSKSSAGPSRSTRLLLRLVVILGVGVAAFVLLEARSGGRRQGANHPAVGMRIPSVPLAPCANVSTGLDGSAIDGKVALVNFWGTWCPPCREEFPHLVALRQKFLADDRFVFVSVSCSMTGDDEPAAVGPETRQYLESEQFDLPVYCDPGAALRIPLSVALKMDGFQYPTTVIVDRHGAIRGLWTGFRRGDEHAMETLVAALLAAP